jgi:hypothetical protein
MPNETDDEQRPPLGVEQMLEALDEVQEAVDRLATERRTTGRRAGHDLTLVEPFSRAERVTLKNPIPGPERDQRPSDTIDRRPARRET